METPKNLAHSLTLYKSKITCFPSAGVPTTPSAVPSVPLTADQQTFQPSSPEAKFEQQQPVPPVTDAPAADMSSPDAAVPNTYALPSPPAEEAPATSPTPADNMPVDAPAATQMPTTGGPAFTARYNFAGLVHHASFDCLMGFPSLGHCTLLVTWACTT